jgi:hypothetical protein
MRFIPEFVVNLWLLRYFKEKVFFLAPLIQIIAWRPKRVEVIDLGIALINILSWWDVVDQLWKPLQLLRLVPLILQNSWLKV